MKRLCFSRWAAPSSGRPCTLWSPAICNQIDKNPRNAKYSHAKCVGRRPICRMTSSKRSLLAIATTKLTKRGSSNWIWVATELLWYFSLWQLPYKDGRDYTLHPAQEMVLFLIITLQVTPGLWLPLFGQLESLKLRNTGLSHSQLVKTSYSQRIAYSLNDHLRLNCCAWCLICRPMHLSDTSISEETAKTMELLKRRC